MERCSDLGNQKKKHAIRNLKNKGEEKKISIGREQKKKAEHAKKHPLIQRGKGQKKRRAKGAGDSKQL